MSIHIIRVATVAAADLTSNAIFGAPQALLELHPMKPAKIEASEAIDRAVVRYE